MASNGKRMVKEDLIKKLENLPEGLEVVEANSTDEATETLSKLTVGDTVYAVPGPQSTGTYVYAFNIFSTEFHDNVGALACFTGISTHNNTAALDAIIEKYGEYMPGQANIRLYDGFEPSVLNPSSKLTNDELTVLYTMIQNAICDAYGKNIINSSSDDSNLIINVAHSIYAEFSGSVISFSDGSSTLKNFKIDMNNSDDTGFASTLATAIFVDLSIYKVA